MKGMEIDPALAQWLKTPSKPMKHRKHNHFTMGKMGYNPKLARLQNHDNPKGERNK